MYIANEGNHLRIKNKRCQFIVHFLFGNTYFFLNKNVISKYMFLIIDYIFLLNYLFNITTNIISNGYPSGRL
jgi:hypothetical protein